MNVDRTWPISAAEQVTSQLRFAIRIGSVRAGTTLPTVRRLAARLRLNPNTVAASYRVLAKEGLVTNQRRGGTRVKSSLGTISAEERALAALTDTLIQLAQKQGRSGAEVIRTIAARWSTAGAHPMGLHANEGLYQFLQKHDYDQA
ncbi:MAG: GntR family transcriptional regulator [Verrucomicrobia bacterium]|nr:GntR family transcriptional regulator [Verrucomicrobiota bacterium]